MLWYYMHYCLVGGLEHFFFNFQRGRYTTNQLMLFASARSQAEYLSWRPPQRPEHLGEEDRSGSRINHRASRKGGLRFYHTGWWFRTWILFFPYYIGNNRAPTDFHIIMIPTDELIIFQRGRYTTNQNVLDMYWTCRFVSDIQFWGLFQVELLEIRPWQSPHSDHRQRISHQLNRGFRFHQIRLVFKTATTLYLR